MNIGLYKFGEKPSIGDVKKKGKEKEAQGNDYNAFLREGFES